MGEFYDSEMYHGKAVFVRFACAIKSSNSYHWEQAFSADGGTTWETNFTWELTREKQGRVGAVSGHPFRGPSTENSAFGGARRDVQING